MQRRFVLRPHAGKLVFAVLFFACCAVVLGWCAATNDRGLIINGVIHLGAESATTFYVVLSVLSGVFVAAALAAAVRSCGNRIAIVLHDHTITLPGPLLRPAPQTIRLEDVREVTIHRISGRDFAYVHHTGGRASFARSMVGEAAFDERKASRYPVLIAR